jgi:hypothetical protein
MAFLKDAGTALLGGWIIVLMLNNGEQDYFVEREFHDY